MDAAAKMRAEEQRRQKAAALRYKRSALEALGYSTIMEELQDIYDICMENKWADESITNQVTDGDVDEDFGYREEFSALSDDAYLLMEQIRESDYDAEGYSGMFDDCTVALIGNRFACVGYDTVETDYFHLCAWDAGRAKTESGKRLMRLTKTDMIDTIGRSFGVLLAFYDLRQRFDYLNTAMSVTLGHNLDTLHTVRSIETAYEAWCEDGCHPWGTPYYDLERVCKELDDVYWVC